MAKGDIWEQRHKKIALPCVRIRTRVAGGSGTVLYSKENGEGERKRLRELEEQKMAVSPENE